MVDSAEERVFWKGRVFDFKVEETTLPDGRRTRIEAVRHPGSSAIVPLQGDRSVLLLNQYRPAIGRFILEIPAGTMHRGEDPLDCARRELEEECGVRGNRFEKMGEILVAPGYSDERIHLYLATELVPSEQRLDEDECLEVRSFSPDAAMEMIRKGEIQDAMTITGLTFAYPRIRGG